MGIVSSARKNIQKNILDSEGEVVEERSGIDLSFELQRANDIAEAYNRWLNRLMTERKKIDRNLKEKKEEVNRLKEELERIRSEGDKNERIIQEKENQIAKLEAKIAELQEDMKSKDKEIFDLKQRPVRQTNLSNTNPSSKSAKELEKDVGNETPKHWSVMKDGEQLRLISLASSDKEYQEVLKDFTSSFAQQPNIQKIERIQNVTLYAQYAAKKKQMESMNPKQKNERTLWHGTEVRDLDSINYNGFNRSYYGKNATMYGAGVYFAVHSRYSDGFAKPDDNNNKHMYRARVLTGDYTQGDSRMRVPPPKDAKNPHILFDSVTDHPKHPCMFVIFQDSQAYPEYLITYQ